MGDPAAKTIDAFVLALPETAGSALYGMVDVLAATGTLWRELVGDDPGQPLIHPRVVSLSRAPFTCGNGIPVSPELAIDEVCEAAIVILPELWLAPSDDMRERYPEVKDWIRRQHQAGSTIYSACSGSVLLASTGLLNGRDATSHWGLHRPVSEKISRRPIQSRAEPRFRRSDRTHRDGRRDDVVA
ncbi:MAG: DJ-1/PfpI family protein [Rhodoplanes sp.]